MADEVLEWLTFAQKVEVAQKSVDHFMFQLEKGGPGSGPRPGGVSSSVREARDNYRQFAPKDDGTGGRSAVLGHLKEAASWAKTGDQATKSGDSAKARESYENARNSVDNARHEVDPSSRYHVDNVDSAAGSARDSLTDALGSIQKGDSSGHPFRGNQWTQGTGGGAMHGGGNHKTPGTMNYQIDQHISAKDGSQYTPAGMRAIARAHSAVASVHGTAGESNAEGWHQAAAQWWRDAADMVEKGGSPLDKGGVVDAHEVSDKAFDASEAVAKDPNGPTPHDPGYDAGY